MCPSFVCFGQFFLLKIILSMSRKDAIIIKEKISSGRWSKTQTGDQNRIYPLFLTAIFYPVLTNERLQTYNKDYSHLPTIGVTSIQHAPLNNVVLVLLKTHPLASLHVMVFSKLAVESSTGSTMPVERSVCTQATLEMLIILEERC